MQHKQIKKFRKKMKQNKASTVVRVSAGCSGGSPRYEKMVKSILGCSGTGNKPGFTCSELVTLMKKRYDVKPKSLKSSISKALKTLSHKGVVIADKSLHPMRFQLSQRGRLLKTREKLDRMNRVYEESRKTRKEVNKYLRYRVAEKKTKESKNLKPRTGTKIISKNEYKMNYSGRKKHKENSQSLCNSCKKKQSGREKNNEIINAKQDSSSKKNTNRKSRRETSTRRSKLNNKQKVKSRSSKSDKQYRFADVVVSQKFLKYLYKTIAGNKKNSKESDKKKRKAKAKDKQTKKKTRTNSNKKANLELTAWKAAQSKRRRRRAKRIERRGSYRNSL